MPLFTMPEWRRPQSERVFSFSARNLFRRLALISFNMHAHKHTHTPLAASIGTGFSETRQQHESGALNSFQQTPLPESKLYFAAMLVSSFVRKLIIYMRAALQ
jgi:hypothetical protein